MIPSQNVIKAYTKGTPCMVDSVEKPQTPMPNLKVDVDPLVSASYSSLFSQEVERRLKHVPIAFYQYAPTKLFGEDSKSEFAGWKL